MPTPPERVLVSACLLGTTCKYDGGHNRDRVLEQELADAGLEPVPFCPEEEGGLSTPRPPASLTAPAEEVLAGRGRVLTDAGRDVTQQFRAGAEAALALCRREGLAQAFLKERSPSCGCAATHIHGHLTQAPGLTTALLRSAGVTCHGVEGRRGTVVASTVGDQSCRPGGGGRVREVFEFLIPPRTTSSGTTPLDGHFPTSPPLPR
jgi:uncharacterized protein YbbK (DUF523 family)